MRLSKFTALAELDARDQDIADADLKALSSIVPTLKQISGCQRGYQYELVATKWAPGKKQGAPLEKIGWSWKKARVRPRVRRLQPLAYPKKSPEKCSVLTTRQRYVPQRD